MRNVRFFSPGTLGEAVQLMGEVKDSRCLAGGQTLGAMINTGLVTDVSLVSLHRISELKVIHRNNDGSYSIGAMTTHSTAAAAKELRGPYAVLGEAANVIAHPPVRNMGTIGGSVCQADPSSDYPAALVAADAKFKVRNAKAIRVIDAEHFFLDFMTSDLRSDEVLTEVLLAPRAPHFKSRYLKHSRAHGDYATLSIAVLLEMARGKCSKIRMALGSAGAHPIRSLEAETRLLGTSLDERDLVAASRILKSACDPVDDVRGSAEYRMMLVEPLLLRAIRDLLQEQIPERE